MEMEINLENIPFDLDFHPSSPLVATGLINGRLHLYRYAEDTQPQRVLRVRAHRKSCRAVRFVNSGSAILTASPDRSILATDVETGTELARFEKAHGAAVNRLVNLTETTIASGDDNGCVKVWDTRERACCNTFDADEVLVSETTYISDMTYVPASMQLLATSGDGILSVCNLRKNKVQTRSDFAEDALLSVVTMKNGRKVVCGTESGALLLYSWGHFEDCSDRFLGHTQPVDTLLKVDEDTVISGCNDGLIRLVGILPNRIIQPLAEHSDYPIEGLAFSSDRKYLGSISHDQMLKLWDLQELLDGRQDVPNSQMVEDGSDDDDDEMDVDTTLSKPSKGNKRKADKGQASRSAADFFADMKD
ncbi:WD repeat-containing protein 55 [Iris pallida]|uniref:WD repeat-containing protein 55 n=1 Tax=Iris pallida TaxID=29817 RepID=A0AAX6ECL1_IRIPA|nr:WD repeat-containing protein 55 [Iris pallida]